MAVLDAGREVSAGLRAGCSICCVGHFTLRHSCVGFCFRIQEASPREWPSEVSSKRTLFPNNERNILKDPEGMSKLLNYEDVAINMQC